MNPAHINIEEDMTDLFQPDVKPTYPGLYPTYSIFEVKNQTCIWQAWNGIRWSDAFTFPQNNSVIGTPRFLAGAVSQFLFWRGFKEPFNG